MVSTAGVLCRDAEFFEGRGRFLEVVDARLHVLDVGAEVAFAAETEFLEESHEFIGVMNVEINLVHFECFFGPNDKERRGDSIAELLHDDLRNVVLWETLECLSSFAFECAVWTLNFQESPLAVMFECHDPI